MAMDRPHAHELIDAVQEFLSDKITPQLSGFEAFQMRIIHNVLDITKREMIHGPGLEKGEIAGLQSLLKTDEADLDTLNRKLCAAIRDGTLSPTDPALLAHLWESTLDKVAIDQPRYATYQREAERNGHSLS